MYVVRTDLRCRVCGVTHEYATKDCVLIVWTDSLSAHLVARALGGRVENIKNVPDGVPYHLYVQKGGRPDPTLPAMSGSHA
jgi:hypothetical protein